MRAFLLVLLAAVVAVSAVPRPGGYVNSGGVYKFDPDKELDYMEQARNAGKFAWTKKLEEEVVSEDVERGARNAAPYVPTFFTQPENHKLLTDARAAQQQQQLPVRAQRETPVYTAPIFYQRK